MPNYDDHISELLAVMDPISLDEMSGIKLMKICSSSQTCSTSACRKSIPTASVLIAPLTSTRTIMRNTCSIMAEEQHEPK